MVLVTAVCFIVKRHRRRLAHREARGVGIEHAGHENPSHGGSGRTERLDIALPLSEETPVQEPPPAYVPAGAASWQGDAEEFHVSTDHLFRMPRTEAILQFEKED